MFKNDMTAEELKATGVKFTTSNYDKDLHFDTIVKGDKVVPLLNKKVLVDVVNYNLKAAQNFIPRLECAEITNPFYTIVNVMKPEDFSVRCYGSLSQKGQVVLNWQLVDVSDDIRKLWKRIISKINKVKSIGEVSENAEAIMNKFKVKDFKQDVAGTWVVLDSNFNQLFMQAQGMSSYVLERCTNLRECVRQQDGTWAICIIGRYATFEISTGEKVTLCIEAASTGMKGETDELYRGIYYKGNYYKRKV